MLTVSVNHHQFITLTVQLSWQHLRWSTWQLHGWCLTKLKWFTWPNHAPCRMVCHPPASTCYLQTTYQIWSLYLHSVQRYERRYKISKMGWFGSLDMVYEFLSAFHSNYVPVLHRFWDIARYWLKIVHFNLPSSIWCSHWGDPIEISSRSLA